MHVQQWVFPATKGGNAALAAVVLRERGLLTEGPDRLATGERAVLVFLDTGQEDAAATVQQTYDAECRSREDLADDGPLAGWAHRRRGEDSALLHRQVGIRVVTETGEAIDLPEGATYEVGRSENLHVLRRGRRIAVFRAGTWRYAQRLFTPDPRGDASALAP